MSRRSEPNTEPLENLRNVLQKIIERAEESLKREGRPLEVLDGVRASLRKVEEELGYIPDEDHEDKS